PFMHANAPRGVPAFSCSRKSIIGQSRDTRSAFQPFAQTGEVSVRIVIALGGALHRTAWRGNFAVQHVPLVVLERHSVIRIQPAYGHGRIDLDEVVVAI